jgi:hypothetical protein
VYGDLLPLRGQPRLDVLVVEARDDGTGGHGISFVEEHLEDPTGHLAPQDALLALDEPRVVDRPAPAAPGGCERCDDREEHDDEHDTAWVHWLLPSANRSVTGWPIRAWSSARCVCAW